LAAGFAVGGKGYVACGLTGTSIIHNTLFAYDPVSNSWSYMAEFPGPARYSATGFALNGLGYVVGGNEGSATGPYSNLMWAYDPVADQWSPRASMPGLSRMACSSFTLNGKAYVLGGRTSDQSFTNEMYAYDPVADTWSACAPVPGVGRTYAQTFELDTRGFVVAGSDQANAGLTDVWAYDPANDSWTAMAAYPSAAYWGGAAFNINGRAFSGMGRYNSIISNELYEFVSPYMGIAETAAEAALVLAPNPCPPGASVSVALPDGRQEQAFDLLVLDDLGRAVHRETLRAGSRPTVQLPELLDGPYTIQLASEGTVIGRGRLVVIGGR
jgi:N-acetylneuraminic acid mutarotase